MSQNLDSAPLNAVREMTAAMLAAAAQQKWIEVQRIDEARSKLLKSISAEAFARNDEILRDALHATRTIEASIIEERETIAEQLQHSAKRQSVAKAYGVRA